MPFTVRRLLIGNPLATERAQHERLNNFQALAIFASDAISSTAYATQEILLALSVAGATAYHLSMPIALAIASLLVIVTASYLQTLFAYPTGGGAYIVAKDNLGVVPAQIAGASLLTDYILTVAVSISAGVAALTSAFPHLHHYTVELCLAGVLLLTLGNLRGLRESGNIFAVPTYFFIVMAYLLLGVGFYRVFVGGEAARQPNPALFHVAHNIGLFLLLKAFASGCAALTGIEAISNGIMAFKPPESKNAAKTMLRMSIVLTTVFLGITWLVRHYGIVYMGGEAETVPSQLAGILFGRGTIYLMFQFATMIVLVLAANTPFAGFPPLAALQAADGFLPRQLANLGEKLVFNNGILVLAFYSSLLIIVFKGNTDHLIPLYAVGVFLSFTLSQSGMVVRWRRVKGPRWQLKAMINGLGAVTTGVVCGVITFTKFMSGAWLVAILIPAMVLLFLKINRHYKKVARQLDLEGYRPKQGWRHHVLVLAPDIHRGVIPALQYARLISTDPRAVHVSVDPVRLERFKRKWAQWSRGIPLVILDSPYRSLVDPVIDYIDRLQEQDPGCLVTVILPEFVSAGFFSKFLHGQTGLTLKLRLFFKRGVVVTDIPYHLESHVVYPTDEEIRVP